MNPERNPEALVRSLAGDMLDHPDPTVRATVLTGLLGELKDAIAWTAEQRGAALVELKDDGFTYDQIARDVGLGTYQAAQKLVREQRARTAS